MKKLFLCISICLSFAFSASLDEGLGRYEAQNYTQAATIFYDLCQQNNNAKACFFLGFMYESAQGVDKDDARAKSYYEKACQLKQANACFNLALLLDKYGQNKQADLSFYQACVLGHKDSCVNLGLRYEAQEDGSLALDFFQRACKLKDAAACFKQGLLYEDGILVRQNIQLASRAFTSSCELNYAPACYALGKIALEKKNQADAKKYFGKACDLTHLNSCEEYKKLNAQPNVMMN
ncbi:sel1 repeat family protein [Campylobacter sp. MIT 19-121]|uniref:tetratricopeptide repeat protein n=1 Tax=Campylobacter sp. MIT 19-121 TaxID=2703906 RepID=UPI00138A6AF0|nr:tetratricopeptide repeat protein [Campylobacter sp. MIT 19-121]NDJ26512.1 sel1 repeat family protein [Campylobacter sp. MIT 19-121]